MHKVAMENRTGLKLSGVVNVKSFDENLVLVDTEEGSLSVKGSGLSVSRLTIEKGEADIDGRIDSLSYTDKGRGGKKSGGFSKLFQ